MAALEQEMDNNMGPESMQAYIDRVLGSFTPSFQTRDDEDTDNVHSKLHLLWLSSCCGPMNEYIGGLVEGWNLAILRAEIETFCGDCGEEFPPCQGCGNKVEQTYSTPRLTFTMIEDSVRDRLESLMIDSGIASTTCQRIEATGELCD